MHNPLILFILRSFGRITVIPNGIRLRVINYFYPTKWMIAHPFTIKHHSLKYQGNLDSYLDWNIFFFNAYEKLEIQLLKLIAKKIHNPIFLDVGANVGYHSLMMARFCPQIISIEPYVKLTGQFKINMKLNNIDNIKIEEIGFSNSQDHLEYYAPIASNKGVGTFTDRNWSSTQKLEAPIKVVRGDDYFADQELPDIIKIDVEGFEYQVLNGLKMTLKSNRPFIMMEYEEDSFGSFENEEYLRSQLPDNYEIFHIVKSWSSRFKLVPFNYNTVGGNILMVPYEKKHLIIDEK